MAATGEVSNYLARNLILSGEAGSGERVGQDVYKTSQLQHQHEFHQRSRLF